MKIKSFNESEAQFIASEIILKRLAIAPKNKNCKLHYSPRLNETLRNIESLEKTWEYLPETKKPSFGQKVSREQIRFWSVPPMSARVLAYLSLYTDSKKVLELGTSAGYSTLHLANAMGYTGGKVHTVEILKDKSKLAKENFKHAGLENKIRLLHGDASDILPNWREGKIDLVFLDADKENYGKYFDQLMPLMSQNGIIVADNINDYGHLMVDYLQKVTGTHLPRSRCDSRVTSTYVAQLDNGFMITRKL